MGKQAFIKKQMEKQLSELYDKKVSEVRNLEGQKQILRDAIGKVIGGDFNHRNNTFFHSVDGTLLRVNTGEDSSVNVEIVRSFNDLELKERTALSVQNPHAYKLLKADLVEVNGTQKVKDLLVSDGAKYQEFLFQLEKPADRPSLEGLSMEDSSRVLREHEEAKTNYQEKVNAYNSDKEAYFKGDINRQMMELDDKIKEIKTEIGE
ncbi:hypothetical protein [Metabacillus sp. FJAT-53654]|uniref:Uncharacterized protein n=1 Tax=Metabacillus rhizosphaerae TaxID=3117747 RepID=A0ABZ2MPR1_9BACI